MELKQDWLVFVSSKGFVLDRNFVTALNERGEKVIIVKKAKEYRELGEHRFTLDFDREADLDKICAHALTGIKPEERVLPGRLFLRSNPPSRRE